MNRQMNLSLWSICVAAVAVLMVSAEPALAHKIIQYQQVNGNLGARTKDTVINVTVGGAETGVTFNKDSEYTAEQIAQAIVDCLKTGSSAINGVTCDPMSGSAIDVAKISGPQICFTNQGTDFGKDVNDPTIEIVDGPGVTIKEGKREESVGSVNDFRTLNVPAGEKYKVQIQIKVDGVTKTITKVIDNAAGAMPIAMDAAAWCNALAMAINADPMLVANCVGAILYVRGTTSEEKIEIVEGSGKLIDCEDDSEFADPPDEKALVYAIIPSSGNPTGDRTRLIGNGLHDGATITIGGNPVLSQVFDEENQTYLVETPPGMTGKVDVVLTPLAGSADPNTTMALGYEYFVTLPALGGYGRVLLAALVLGGAGVASMRRARQSAAAGRS